MLIKLCFLLSENFIIESITELRKAWNTPCFKICQSERKSRILFCSYFDSLLGQYLIFLMQSVFHLCTSFVCETENL